MLNIENDKDIFIKHCEFMDFFKLQDIYVVNIKQDLSKIVWEKFPEQVYRI